MSWAYAAIALEAAPTNDPNALTGSPVSVGVTFSATLADAPGPTETVFTNAGGSQIVLYESYSAGTYTDKMQVGATFTQATTSARPTADTTLAPSGRTMLSCDGGDSTVGGTIPTGSFPVWSGTKTIVEHFIIRRPAVPDDVTNQRPVDYNGNDYWLLNIFGAGEMYRTGARSDSGVPLAGATVYYLTIEHDVASGVSTMTVNGVAQSFTGTNGASTRTDLIGTKCIGAETSGGSNYTGHVGNYGIGQAPTWGPTQRAALYQAQQDWFNGVAGGALTGSVSASVTLSGTLTGAGALTGSAAVAVNPAGTLTGAGALSGSTALSISPAGTLAAYAFGTGSVAISVSPSGTLAGSGALTGSSPISVSPSGTLTGSGALSGSSALSLVLSATGTSTYFTTGSFTASLSPAGTLRGAGALTGATSVAISPAGTLAGAGALTGSTTASLSPAGTLLGAGALSGSAALAINPAATLTGAGALTGSVPIALTFAGTLLAQGSGQMSGSAPISLTLSGTLTGAGALSGSTQLSISPSAFLTGRAPLTGSTTLSLSPSGTLTGAGALTGSTFASITPAGVLTGAGALTGSTSATLTFNGTVLGAGALTGSTDVALTASGTLTGAGALSGSIPVALTLTGGLNDLGGFRGIVALSLTFSGDLANLPIAPADVSWTFGPATVIAATVSAQAGTAISFSQAASTVVTETAQTAAIKIIIEQLMTLYVGDLNHIDFEFRDGHTNALLDPSSVEFVVLAPSDNVHTVYTFGTDDEVTKRATGQYRAAIPCTEAGRWFFTARSPGPAGMGAKPGSFDVEPVNT